MPGDAQIQMAHILIEQKRFAEAGSMLRTMLGQDPNNVYLLALLSQAELMLDHIPRAEELIDTAIGLSPDSGYLYYIKARVQLRKEKYGDAEKSLLTAISIDPEEADYFALLASVKLSRKQYAEALETADQSLARDPENILGSNIRSTALLKLNRKGEFFEAMEGALSHDPNNAYTHANFGWGLLEKGEHNKALYHFREALVNDPQFAYAQRGMLEALKARYIFYRLFLKYSFFISNLTAKYQWGVIVGFYALSRVLGYLARTNETLAPFLTPVIILMAVVAFSTWVITPLSNLFLRFNKYGQFLLSPGEKLSSNLVAGSLVVCLAGIGLFLGTGHDNWLIVALVGFAMMVPLSSVFGTRKLQTRLLIYTGVMLLLGIAGIAATFYTGDPANMATIGFLISFFAYQWIANFLRMREE